MLDELYEEDPMQRLFSSFANGWPGKGLALQRLAAAGAVLLCEVPRMRYPSPLVSLAVQLVATSAGSLLLLGLWTPVVGVAVTCCELSLSFMDLGALPFHLLMAVLGLSIAMIGPGSWSIDARLFGRKRIDSALRRRSVLRK